MPKYDLHFDLVESSRQQRQLADFLRTNVGDYDAARHAAWVDETCMPAIARDERRALAWWQLGHMVGDVVIKPLAPNVAEIKNFRIRQGNEGVHLGAVMMAHAFKEAVDLLDEQGLIDNCANEITVQLDTRPPLESYFDRFGWTTTAREELYGPGREEVIMQRTVPLH